MSTNRRRPRIKKSPQDQIWVKIKKIILGGIYFCLISSIGVFGYLYYLSQNLPSLEEMINPTYDLPTQIYDRDNNLVREFYTQRRVVIRFDQVPDVVIKATMAIEDNRFYDHFGIDPLRILKAFWVNVTTGSIAQGGSTLTQQTAKNFLLSRDKKILRKIKEILLALKIESQFTKNQILELYLNRINYGHGNAGIEAAALSYFGKNVEELTLPEAALLAGIPQAPSRLAPTASIKRATKKRNLVLTKMHDFGYITTAEMLREQMTPIELKLNKEIDYNETSYYAEHVRRYIYNKYGGALLYRGGMKVYTSMDLSKQIYAQNALHRGLVAHDRRQGYRGPQKNVLKEVDEELGLDLYSDDKGWNSEEYKILDEEIKSTALSLFNEKIAATTEKNKFIIGGNVLGVVTEVRKSQAVVNLGDFQGNLLVKAMKWARPVDFNHKPDWSNVLKDFNEILKMGDVIELEIQDFDNDNDEFILTLTQKPIANGAVFVMDPQNGQVLAISGGFDYRDSEFNRAIQGKRQTGSIFKAIVYSLALESSFTAASLLDDSPFVGEGEEKYKPKNYSKRYSGKMSLRKALVKSQNSPAVRLTKELGTKAVIQHARKLGITGNLPEDDLSIVLGSSSLTLEEMTRTFSIFANGGKLLKPVYITKIVDRDGVILEKQTEVVPSRVLGEETAFLMTNILEDVVVRGTGWRARAINRPSAGKTGSTDNYVDAWYMGYIPQLITGVYVGFDKNRHTLGDEETGSKAALPIWVDFMKNATATMPIYPFGQPDGINMVRIVTESGLLDCNAGGKTRFEYFKSGTEPTQCHRNSPGTSIPSNTPTKEDGTEQAAEPEEEL
ncbi:MAG: PBP1A family penicillin-binding protein [Deltaproteobacteria bacterium]|nr:PBP1A family penicillin-binding protein [Deltaproteobacteria bacterium]